MKSLLTTAAVVLALSAPAFAGPSSSGAHGSDHGNTSMQGMDHSMMMPAGMPGEKGKVSRTIKVTMSETDDGKMIFTPNKLDVKQGETVRIKITNKGELDHEFVLDTAENNAAHKGQMASGDAEGAHQMPNSVTLEPGKQGDIFWTFTNSGDFEFACLIPGHYESGMFGTASVS